MDDMPYASESLVTIAREVGVPAERAHSEGDSVVLVCGKHRLTITGRLLRMSHDEEGWYMALGKEIGEAWHVATAAERYTSRPRAKLGAGTVGYARRRR